MENFGLTFAKSRDNMITEGRQKSPKQRPKILLFKYSQGGLCMLYKPIKTIEGILEKKMENRLNCFLKNEEHHRKFLFWKH